MIGSRSHKVLADEYRAALDQHMLDIRDTGFIPEHSAAESWEASQHETVYPLKEIMTIAAHGAERYPAHGTGFVAALSNGSAVVRHWAARGLRGLAAAGQSLPDGIEAAYAAERNPQVRIPLAESLGRENVIDAGSAK